MKLRPALSRRYYTPELSPFIVKWQQQRVQFLARTWVNPLDNVTMYSCFVAIPNTGVVVEVLSASLSDEEHAKHFEPLEPASCPAAVMVNRTLDEMSTVWTDAAGRMTNTEGLPDVLIVQLAIPTAMDPREYGYYLQKYASLARGGGGGGGSGMKLRPPLLLRYASLNVTTEYRHHDYAVPGARGDATCDFASTRLKMQPSSVGTKIDWHVDVKSVRNRGAAGGVDGVKAHVGATAGIAGSNATGAAPKSPAKGGRWVTDRDDRHDGHALKKMGAWEDKNSTKGSATNYSVANFERVVSSANAELLGCNSGWSRYLDWHIGVWCAAPETLDAIGPKLCEAGSGSGGGFHAHISSPNKRVSSAGSIWAAGVGGLGVEFHMNFDWQFFNESIVSLLDYCSGSSRGICTENSCDESDTIRRFV